jgi:hypothetical protein
MATIQQRHIPALEFGDAYLAYQHKPTMYMFSTLLPNPLWNGKYLSFDVFLRRSNTSAKILIYLSGGNGEVINSTILDGVVHMNPSPIRDVGIGSLAYYSTAIASLLATYTMDLRSNRSNRTGDAANWWSKRIAAGLASTTPDGKYDVMNPKVAAQNLYIWRYGSTPSWIKNGKILNSEEVRTVAQFAVENGPSRDLIKSMMGNVYTNSPEVRGELIVRENSPLGSLRGVLRKPSSAALRAYEE